MTHQAESAFLIGKETLLAFTESAVAHPLDGNVEDGRPSPGLSVLVAD
jgi:hypothetical protein